MPPFSMGQQGGMGGLAMLYMLQRLLRQQGQGGQTSDPWAQWVSPWLQAGQKPQLPGFTTWGEQAQPWAYGVEVR